MSVKKYESNVAVYEYDFAVSGGAVSTINLTNLSNVTLDATSCIRNVEVVLETALAGAGATVTVGTAGDKDGFFVDMVTLLNSQKYLRAGDLAGALIWDDTNDQIIGYRPAAAIVPCIEIGTAVLTAGKFKVLVEFFSAE